jgi:hypothetical protein
LPAIIPKQKHLAKYKTTSQSTATKVFKMTPISTMFNQLCSSVIDGGFQEGVDEDDSHW